MSQYEKAAHACQRQEQNVFYAALRMAESGSSKDLRELRDEVAKWWRLDDECSRALSAENSPILIRNAWIAAQRDALTGEAAS